MNLRVRLIVAFVVLSVVPLGAMTWYTYWSNAQALRDAAEEESDTLAGELSDRMQLITTQLSERVDQLLDMESDPAAAPASAATAAFEAQVADTLGDAAMLLNTVELRGLPRGRGAAGSAAGATGGARGDQSPAGSRGNLPPPGTGSRAGGDRPPIARGATPPGRRAGGRGFMRARPNPGPASPTVSAPGSTPATPPTSAAAGGAASVPSTGAPSSAVASPGVAPAGASAIAAADVSPTPAAPMGPAAPTPPAAAGPGSPPAPGDRITIDLSTIRREMFREIAPDRTLAEMTPAERQRVISEVNQRLLGIQDGLRMGAAALQKQATEAKREAAAPPRSTAPRAVNAGTAALTGNRLIVRREQNGVDRQINAEVNLPDLLLTVFSATPRRRGEVPFAIDKDAHIYTTTADDRKKIEAFGADVTGPNSTLGTKRLAEWIIVTTADPTGSGLRFGIARPVGEALSDIRRTAARSAGLGLLFICATLVVIVPLSAGLTRNLSRLTDGVRRLASGDYRARVAVTTHDEIGELAQAFNQMAGHVEQHQRAAVEQTRIKRELELGRQIQNDMLPHTPLLVGRTEVQGVSVAAGEVGGDFFNYFELPNGRIALLVGDVSGKGVGAALLMANIQASLRTRLSLGQGLTALADEIDRDVHANTPGPVYSTLFIGILDPAARLLRYVNAGHNPQYVLRRRGGLDRLESSGLPVGLLPGRGYAEGQVQLGPDDLVFCYTDGCVEAENEAGEMLGADALERELLSAGPLSAAALLHRVETILTDFRGDREPFDDATMMVVKVG